MLVTGSEDGEVRLHDLSTFDTTQVSILAQDIDIIVSILLRIL